ncbi:SycD/LcrH family type III secretion system chaperone [Pleionea sp. CnH1-48]|uniref:SycD/LcrH family type III secretion system chaperone n=1 Tax=Pleionea sp. CnH1-48 TaxID=2954494 RepID=UPI0020975FB4|nr:SycD/LcrH family type III secretion system chaperone [Pleionea sp. CnH1-48]MCO7227025.1 SycD/LcrH family type III secretion system chaperone [Pleionea sp. CnH1-48]
MSILEFEHLSEDEQAELQQQWQQVMEAFYSRGGEIVKAKGVSKEYMEQLYSFGYELFEQEKWAEAEKVFNLLCYYSHLTQSYWLALGASQRNQKKYKEAINALCMASILDVKDPMPPYLAGHCHKALNNQQKALDAFSTALKLLPRDSQKPIDRNELKQLIEELSNQ